MTFAAAKTAAREAALAARKRAHQAAQGHAQAVAQRHLQAVLAAHAGKVLAGYMPMRNEIDPLPAMAAHSGPVAVPVIVARAAPLRFREWHPATPMVRGTFGALIPETGVWCDPQVLIVPLVAFDGRGMRLGYGGGFYDRTLEYLRAQGPVLAIGFAYAAQELPEVPAEPVDQPLDAVVTEDGLRSFGARTQIPLS
ncbi:5-formyltetrahydrofolate cyclo-ligase [Plastorhodobacter daqingensis]|uniref:5-formyltetrahydrofolate cyclo-ligase n=1 Tax=Plastorhodobacter daqingensis TaxID=1387281 RepID=A0ABW2UQI7_9RHOB